MVQLEKLMQKRTIQHNFGPKIESGIFRRNWRKSLFGNLAIVTVRGYVIG